MLVSQSLYVKKFCEIEIRVSQCDEKMPNHAPRGIYVTEMKESP